MPSHGTACSSRAPPTCRSRSPRTPSLERCARSSTVDPVRISQRMILRAGAEPAPPRRRGSCPGEVPGEYWCPGMTTSKPAVPLARDADAELEALFAAINDVILVLDAEGRYVKIAPTNPALLYRPAAELLGKTLREVFDGAHDPRSGGAGRPGHHRSQAGRRAAARQRAAVPGAGRARERRRHAARSGRDDPVRQPIHAARARLRGDRKRGAECLRAGPPRRPP